MSKGFRCVSVCVLHLFVLPFRVFNMHLPDMEEIYCFVVKLTLLTRFAMVMLVFTKKKNP